MKNLNKSALLLVLVPLTLSSGFALAAPSARDKAREEKGREDLAKRGQEHRDAMAAGRAEDHANARASALSLMTNGRVDSIAIAEGAKAIYTVEVPGRTGPQSKAVVVKISDAMEGLQKNFEFLKSESERQNLSAEGRSLIDAKMKLVTATIELMALASNRYEGSDATLVLARDAFARQVETGVKMTSKDSIATLSEVNEHQTFIEAIVREKQNDSKLTDAEATLKGVEKAYRETFEARCKDGSCKVPSNDVLSAGARARLKDLKECI